MKNILFLCTGNSCRSQMAEGFGRALKGEYLTFYSAGIKKHGLNPYAVASMKDIEIDISEQASNTLDEIDVIFDYVFTVCSEAHESCPIFSEDARVIHIGFDDPPMLTKEMSDPAEILLVYARVRDEIRTFILDIESHL
jgi:arsenate reductase (thioredoxin)